MADIDQLYTALQKADAAGDTEGAKQLASYIRSYKAPDTAAAPVEFERDKSMLDNVKDAAGNVAAGAVRGAGSIGATLLAPVDWAAKKMGISNSFIGRDDRREAMDQGLQQMGADPNSIAFKTGKIGTEIAGTAGAGGAIAQGLRAVPGVAAAAPGVLDAISSAGFNAGGLTGAGGAAARAAGGAISGSASAGMVDPTQAADGALIGGALPGALRIAGAGGQAVGKLLGGQAQTADQLAAVDAARAKGLVIPPTQAKPSVVNKILEGLSGKITTAQNASAQNAPVFNASAAKALGLAADTPISPELLQTIRKRAGDAYDAVGQTGTVVPDKSYGDALDKIAAPYKKAAEGFPDAKPSPVIALTDSLRSPQFDAGSAVAKIKELRSAADDAFRTGNTDVGRASKGAAGALEDALKTHLEGTGDAQALTDFQDARQLIAKTYSVEKALNPTTGTVDANKLAQQLTKGKPLSGELKDIAEFAQRFPKAAQTPERMGSLPQSSPLDWAASGGLAAATHSTPIGMIGMAARPIARKVALSNLVQSRLGSQSPNQRLQTLRALSQAGLLRSAPLIGSDQ